MKRRWLRKLLRRIDVVRVDPGDVLVISTDRPITQEEAAEATARLRAFFPGSEQVFLPHGWRVDAVRPDREAS